MSILDKPLAVIFPELNSLQINMIRELMKREYERGKAVSWENIKLTMEGGALHKYVDGQWITVSEPTPMNYTANVDKDKE